MSADTRDALLAGAARLLPGHWVAGAWTGRRADAVTTNPAHPEREVSHHALATAEEVDAAVAAANAAREPWRRTTAVERCGVLRRTAAELERRQEQLATMITLEQGKVLAEARSEVARAVDTLHYHATRALAPTGERYDSSTPDEQVSTLRSPVGVVAAITPWNFPLAIPVWKLAPALAHGNTVVWKPAEATPAVTVGLVEALAAAGLPAGVVNLVLGTGADAGRRLVDHPDVAAITFTGSVEVGRQVLARAAPRGAKVQLELGGHNPALVFDDADLDTAAGHVVAGAMLGAGQKCTATRRVLVQRAVHDALVERILARVANLRVGDGMVPGTDLGPLISQSALHDVVGAVDAARADGACVLAGGHPLEGSHYDGGHFIAPTVLGVDNQRPRVCREEVFGPVTAVLAFDDDTEGFALANATSYGLSAAVHTRSLRRAHRAVDELDVGQVMVNGPTTGAEVHAPFGGVKGSSAPGPREQGQAAREFFTREKTAYLRLGTLPS